MNTTKRYSQRRFLANLLLLAVLVTACGRGDYEEPPSTFTENWWVSTTGDDGNSCNSPSSPCLTIRGAIMKSNARDAELMEEYPSLVSISNTIRVEAGVYEEPGMAGTLLYVSKPLNILGAGAGATILDARGALGGIFINGGSAGDRINIGALTIRNTVLGPASACVESRSDAIVRLSSVNLENCLRAGVNNFGSGQFELYYANVSNSIDEYTDPSFTLNGDGVINHGSMSILGSTISANEANGIFNFGRLFIRSSTIENNQLNGIVHDSSDELNLTDVTIADNALRGIGQAISIRNGPASITRGLISGHPHRAISVHSTLDMVGTTISMNDAGALHVYPEATAVLDNVTITDNGAVDGFDIVHNTGDLTITNSLFGNNHKTALYNTLTGTAAISDSEFRNHLLAGVNLSVVYNGDDAEMSLTRVLVAGNRTGDRSAIETFGRGTLVNVTVSGNNSFYAVRGRGNLDISFTTIADNTNYGILTDGLLPTTISNVLFARNAGGDCQFPFTSYAGVTLSGFSIDTDGTCEVSATYAPADLYLGPLADNGGPTQTHELMVSPDVSPAIDAATGACPSDDQRAVARPVGPACDVGAYEAGFVTMSLEIEGEESETETPTPELATFTLDTDANCRRGDSSAYSVVTSFSAGQSFQIDGRNAATTWFWILMPQGGHCWLAGSTGTASGPYDAAAIIALPTATPTQPSGGADGDGDGDGGQPGSPPAAPANSHVANQVCTAQEYSVQLSWFDQADNEEGYRIYRDGNLIATLGPNSQSHTDHPPYGGPYNYTIEAFNSAGAASDTTQDPGCLA